MSQAQATDSSRIPHGEKKTQVPKGRAFVRFKLRCWQSQLFFHVFPSKNGACDTRNGRKWPLRVIYLLICCSFLEQQDTRDGLPSLGCQRCQPLSNSPQGCGTFGYHFSSELSLFAGNNPTSSTLVYYKILQYHPHYQIGMCSTTFDI